MTPEEAEMRERLCIKESDITHIPADAFWELCRQFNDALPGHSDVGDAFYGFYCKRMTEIAVQRAKVKKDAIESFKQFPK
jgi:hypothetical protein